jgi:hypothetical protein
MDNVEGMPRTARFALPYDRQYHILVFPFMVTVIVFGPVHGHFFLDCAAILGLQHGMGLSVTLCPIAMAGTVTIMIWTGDPPHVILIFAVPAGDGALPVFRTTRRSIPAESQHRVESHTRLGRRGTIVPPDPVPGLYCARAECETNVMRTAAVRSAPMKCFVTNLESNMVIKK